MERPTVIIIDMNITKQNLNIQHNLCQSSYDISHRNRVTMKVM